MLFKSRKHKQQYEHLSQRYLALIDWYYALRESSWTSACIETQARLAYVVHLSRHYVNDQTVETLDKIEDTLNQIEEELSDG